MRNIILLAAVFAIRLPLAAQQIKTIDDIKLHVKNIDSNKAIKRYSATYELRDAANQRKPVQYEYIADTLTGNLIKAIIKDERFHLTRIYYFVNDRLIKLYEKDMDESNGAISYTHYVRDMDYSITRIAQSEMYDDKAPYIQIMARC